MQSSTKTTEMWIGTDLGTSNSCVSVYQQSTQTLLIPTANGSVLLPSLVHFSEDGTVLVGEAARIAGLRFPERTIFSAKRMLGRKFSDAVIQDGIKTWPFKVIEGLDGFPLIELMIGGKMVHKTPVDVQTELLQHVRTELAQQVLHWDECKNIVITVPAYFNHNQRHCTIQAAYQAGFSQVHIINEPSAAAFYFGYKESALADRLVNNILVFDLGGGTLDVSLIDVKDKIYRVVSTDGDTQFGGFDIDKFIVDWLIDQIRTKYGFDVHLHSNGDEHLSVNLSKLSTIAEKLKKSLSSLSSVTESSIYLRGVPESNRGFEDGFEVVIDRAVLNRYFVGNRQGRASTLRAIQRCVKKANLTLKDIHKVILVGGSTRIPAIPKMITQFFQNPDIVAKTVNADEAVALGACLHAATLSHSPLQQLKKPIELYDIAPLAYNIAINSHLAGAGGNLTSLVPFIPRNSCLVRDHDIVINHKVFCAPDQDGRVKFELVESDDAVEGSSGLGLESAQQEGPLPPGSPTPPTLIPDHTDEVLHTVDVFIKGTPPTTTTSVPSEEEFEIELRLTSDYKLFISITHCSSGIGVPSRIITPFQRYSTFQVEYPPPQSQSQSHLQSQSQSQPEPEPEPQQLDQKTPKASTAISTTNLTDDLIKGQPPAYWKKENWVEIDDHNGLYYKNTVTGDTTFYEDDFDLESQ